METQFYDLDIPLPRSWEDFDDEQLYWMLAHRSDTFEPYEVSQFLDILAKRYIRWCVYVSKSSWTAFRWTRDDAEIDMLEHIWGLARRGTIKGRPGVNLTKGSFSRYFKVSYRGHMKEVYRAIAKKNPMLVGDITIGQWSKNAPIIFGVYTFRDDLIEKWRETARRSNERLKEKKRFASKTFSDMK